MTPTADQGIKEIDEIINQLDAIETQAIKLYRLIGKMNPNVYHHFTKQHQANKETMLKCERLIRHFETLKRNQAERTIAHE